MSRFIHLSLVSILSIVRLLEVPIGTGEGGPRDDGRAQRKEVSSNTGSTQHQPFRHDRGRWKVSFLQVSLFGLGSDRKSNGSRMRVNVIHLPFRRLEIIQKDKGTDLRFLASNCKLQRSIKYLGCLRLALLISDDQLGKYLLNCEVVQKTLAEFQGYCGSTGEEEKTRQYSSTKRLAGRKSSIQSGPVPFVRGCHQLFERLGYHLPGEGFSSADWHNPWRETDPVNQGEATCAIRGCQSTQRTNRRGTRRAGHWQRLSDHEQATRRSQEGNLDRRRNTR